MTPDQPPLTLSKRAPAVRRAGWLLASLLGLVSASGASCPQVLQQYTQPIPRALPAGAPLSQIVDVVNQNSARVQSLSASRATITTPGVPALNADIAIQRPRSFRLVARTFIGPEFDLGSNDELLWFWVKRSQPPALYFCRHDQFAASAARQIVPVEPEWLIEAFGLVTLNPADHIEGPFPVGNGRVEIRSRSTAPGKEGSRITIIDASRGIVLEEHLYDAQGVRLASAVLSKHVRDPASEATLPRHVEIQWPPAKFELTVDLPELHINQLTADPHELFTKPVKSGYPDMDLAQPIGPLTPTATAPGGQPAPLQNRY
jgi:hypothetical protein